MSKFDEHPTVKHWRKQEASEAKVIPSTQIDAQWLRHLCLEAGADDVGFVEIDRPEIADQRQDILAAFPPTKTLISFVCRMNRENVRSPARSVANLEFHSTGDEVNHIARQIVAELERHGIRGFNPAMGFPMEMNKFPGKVWSVSHKPVAVAAGLGQMGIHRLVIHPKFGNFILLGTILIDVKVTTYHQSIDYNPCLECKLCVSACPVGAISADGHFNFSACYTHNYREFMGGFTDWVETIVESKDRHEYGQQVNAAESASVWQSLSYGANYKAAYCMAVCPAGEDVIAPFLTRRKEFIQEVVKPLQAKEETIYVVPNSDAEAYVTRRFPHKQVKQVRNSLIPTSIRGFLGGMPSTFQREHSKGLNAIYHFTFIGAESCKATVIIRHQTLEIQDGHLGTANLAITADSKTWLKFLAKEQNLVWAIVRRQIRFQGQLRLLLAFGKCFPQ
ncbi:4Fe-4S ferredoxin iron-sulfur binding domain protein [Tolypothrix tenuis PCC 7101]|uniref:4Fe-4S ferredoxin iron-sulfur binding domain protein n=1 Tax=Tolypothrix tenuis PCC 7101 TaxID=231146 RepID=A0A1Z4N536_9CYAN|nr:4Fe-4S binding protein [Aulosira sp. FACHB-113]BAZ00762.1 4Fe-4S ferredoxin iron-sulfur binding domain protein [Tolypothrix tenuis PCC 7101]BAZ75315.1 4Fe-4S ferredoxin iron-sulfur binding domain protein [Aulosira laxa NIES-50]